MEKKNKKEEEKMVLQSLPTPNNSNPFEASDIDPYE